MPADAPKAKVPVLRKVTALVIAVPVAFKAKLYAWLAVVKVGTIKAPLKVTVAASVVSVRVMLVPTVTAPAKVTPPEFCTVMVPMSVPMVSATVKVLKLLITT